MEKQSDVTSVQPLWHSLVGLSIIGLDVDDGDDAGVTVGGGEEDLRPLETAHVDPVALIKRANALLVLSINFY